MWFFAVVANGQVSFMCPTILHGFFIEEELISVHLSKLVSHQSGI